MGAHFIIIGAQKAATTFIHHCLREHPDVFMPGQAAPFFEDPDYSVSRVEAFEKLFEAGHHSRITGMKRPSYMSLPECPERIRTHLPLVKLIAILRDPVDRAISAYYHQALMGFAPIKDADRGLPGIIDGKYNDRYPRSAQVIEFGFYYKHLTRYLAHFQREQLLVILYEDVVTDPLRSLRTIFRFLGIEEDYIPRSLASRPRATVYSLARLRWLTLQNRIAYTYSADGMRLHAKQKVGRVESRILRLINDIDRKVLSRALGDSSPKVSRSTTRMLASVYAEYTARLQDLLGVRLSHWRPLQPAG